MNIGYIGLGKMGSNMVARMNEKGHTVTTYTRSGGGTVKTIPELVTALPTPRIVWIMVTASAVDMVLADVLPLLSPGDTIIDGGNSPYLDTQRRAVEITAHGISFVDVGVSGGPGGARNGACLMIGGEQNQYDALVPLWRDLSVADGYGYMGTHGAGHFVKMVHNGIEYGMMQSIAEGFAVLKASPLQLQLSNITRVYNTGSVIESRLIGWLRDGYVKYGEDLADITSTVAHTGEGAWTVEAAHLLNIPVPIIEGSLEFRKQSGANPSYTGRVLSTLRNMFGGHDAGVQ
jgi:6-phosphogluconate dehydrogenase